MPYADPAQRAARQRTRYKTPFPLPIKYGTAAHVALGYMKMRRVAVEFSEFKELTPKLSDPRPPVGRLVEVGFAAYDELGRPSITPAGVAALYELARRNASKGKIAEEE